VGDTWRQYYSGAGWKHGMGGIGAHTSHIGINGPQQTGVAEIGAGRWVDLRVAPEAWAGEVTSIGFRLAQPLELTVNVEHGSAFACGIVNPETGAFYAGFGYDEFDRLQQDGQRVPCAWRGRGLKALGAAPIRLRARLEGRVRLFGWTFA
jgi:hypothetical protein